jgi:hypothetical protein
MSYKDFTIRCHDWKDGQFKVEVTDSPIHHLALEPRLSLVCHKAIPSAPGSMIATRPPKMMVSLSAASNAPKLDLALERHFIEAVLLFN